MPEIYQPFSPKNFEIKNNRTDYGLPENAFILGCFSRIEKILPNIFNIWMKVLNKHSDAYLALCINSQKVINNINKYCEENNYDFNRIIFLKSIDHEDNLIRVSNFDLYLDTFPYNGHTGISDSLFQSCVPTISITGNSFASRVSCSLLRSLKLEKLVTYSEKDYFDKILYYCSNREELKKIKKYLIDYKKNNLNRMSKFTSDFEKLVNSIVLKNKIL
jgi:predicted O-linked N-acetylglucosamine transferase (SPINDLY family)